MKRIAVEVCVGTHCTMMGALNIMELIGDMQREYRDRDIDIECVKCFGNCKDDRDAPVVMVNGDKITRATSERVMAKISEVINS